MWQAMPADLVTAQIEAVAGDIGADAVKIGMLGNAAIVEAVAAAIADLDLPLVVVDPVMVAKGGDRLLEEDAVDALRAELLPRARIVTPNVPEAEVLAGMTIASVEDMRAGRGPDPRAGPARRTGEGRTPRGRRQRRRVLFDGTTLSRSRKPRVDTRHTHGTGCTLSSAIAANLALGRNDRDAVTHAPRIPRRRDPARGRHRAGSRPARTFLAFIIH